MTPAISVLGLGKLGFPIAACLAAKGFDVVGVDTNPRTLARVADGAAPVAEPGLDPLWSAARPRLRATDDAVAAVRDTGLTFVFVPTPSAPDGGFALDAVLDCCRRIGEGLRGKKERHVVVINSTVMPGAIDGRIRPALASAGGRDFGLCYNPQFVALGSVVRDFLSPDFTLIGESDAEAGDRLEAVYARVLDRTSPVARMNLVNAELVKLALNSYVTMKISFANLVARLCERLPGANADAVTAALGLDSRIGPKYLKGALGYGGPCFPRDNAALAALARSCGVTDVLPQATDAMNRAQIAWLAREVRRRTPPGARIAVLGLSYKPQTPVVDESQGLALATALAAEGAPVSVYDPAALNEARRVLGSAVAYCASVEECIRDAGTIVVATPWEEFRDLPVTDGALVVDCWRIIDRRRLPATARYLALGENLR